MILKIIKHLVKLFGINIQKYNPANVEEEQIIFLLSKHNIDVVIDIGANVGQYGLMLRKLNYDKRIISFEPISECYEMLKRNKGTDNLWDIYKIAAGDFDGTSQINISNNLVSSSLLKPHEKLPMYDDGIRTVKTETITVSKLDSFFGNRTIGDSIYLKIDVQGFERETLEGGLGFLKSIKVIQVESSLSSFYNKGSKIEDIMSLLRDQGFLPYNFIKGVKNNSTGQLFEVDIFFVREQFVIS